MHSLHGNHLIAGEATHSGTTAFRAFNPATGTPLEPPFFEATVAEVHAALSKAQKAFRTFGQSGAEVRALLLEKIADEILALGEALLQRAHEETGLPLERLTGERGRSVGQIRQFAAVLREGSWCGACIDTALPERQPLPRPDLRRVLVPLGPVVVFGASNFPLAFSVAGGDTASALAAGCPVVVKGHPAHPGTCELVASAINKAISAAGLNAGIFSLVHGREAAVGLELVRHPAASAVGFTGSLQAGRALLDAAQQRSQPIPVFAEMSSVNPLVILPGALKERGAAIAEGLKNSVALGVGQFCTKPGLVFTTDTEGLGAFLSALNTGFGQVAPGTMLHAGIAAAYRTGVERLSTMTGVTKAGASAKAANLTLPQAEAAVFTVDTAGYRAHPSLQHELFGPQTLVVVAKDVAEILALCEDLEGQLTATVHATPHEEVDAHVEDLIAVLQRKAGRLVWNGFPTGVEVSPAMQHGGPYPASTDARYTSVGTASIQRWVRPVCYQNFPEDALPAALQNANPLGLMRLVNSEWTRAGI